MSDVLIVIDMQNDFLDTNVLGTAEGLAIIDPMVDFIEKWKGGIIFTKDSHSEKFYSMTQEGRLLPIPHCIVGTKGRDICDELQKFATNSFCLNKNTFGSAGWFDIDLLADADSITLVGVCTDICVISNALILKAIFPHASIRVIENLCAGSTIEKHNAAIEVMKSCQVLVSKYEEEK